MVLAGDVGEQEVADALVFEPGFVSAALEKGEGGGGGGGGGVSVWVSV